MLLRLSVALLIVFASCTQGQSLGGPVREAKSGTTAQPSGFADSTAAGRNGSRGDASTDSPKSISDGKPGSVQSRPGIGKAQPGSFMAENFSNTVQTRREVIHLWTYGELLFWENPPVGYREFITYRADPSRPTVHAFYLPPGADPYKDSLQTLFNKGAFESTRWYAPPGDPGDDALDPEDRIMDPAWRDPDQPLPKDYKLITVRGVQAKLSESRTDCRGNGTKCEDWQTGSNVDRRKVLATRKKGAGLVQWATQGHWNARTVEEQIQITEALKAYNR